MSVRIVLASASPRRAELLRGLGLDPDIVPAGIDESRRDGEAAVDYVRRLAGEKAEATAIPPGTVVIAADTAVAVDGVILGKPVDADEAREMLRRLAGRHHDVHTGVAVHAAAPGSGEVRAESAVVTTRVMMVALSEAMVDWYVATGEPLDKAGAYGLQGRGSAFVRTVRGSVSNVIGLPLAETAELLRRLPWFPPIGAVS